MDHIESKRNNGNEKNQLKRKLTYKTTSKNGKQLFDKFLSVPADSCLILALVGLLFVSV